MTPDLDQETAELVMGRDAGDGDTWEPTSWWLDTREVVLAMGNKGWAFRQDEIPNRPPQAMFYKGSHRYVACGATILEAICQAAVTTMKDKR